ncbi:MAG: DNA polymerase III subunit alpha, partial [Spirochaetia bacterium]|nr:DNA polymerase III subunit alpha [Spirochaetia bacterium]
IYTKLISISRNLEGLNRHASLHAAGLVIGREELTKYVPLYKDAKTNAVSTQFTMDQLEECGLVKMDFLGLKTLTLIKNTENLIRKNISDFQLTNIPDYDEKTFQMLGEGKSACIFQFESPGMQKILKDTKPESIEDLIALNALYRPGPMQNIPQFISSKNGRTPIKYPDPSLKEVLKPTYGVIVYQEQVIKVAQIMAGFSLGKADILRRAMGKKDIVKMAKMKVEFIEGARKNGHSEKHSDEIFEMLRPFAGYGFNKSHAAAYSVLAYQTAYLKANFPAQFMSANLTNEINDPVKLGEYITESRHMGLEILPPDINLSERNFTVADGKIVYGLIGIKNVGTAAVDEIIRERTENGAYSSFTDFLNRSDLRVINKKVLETLIKSGLFDSIESGRAILFSNLDRLVDSAAREQENRKYGQSSLFDASDNNDLPPVELEMVNEWPEKELLTFEKENLGFYFSGHPLKKYKSVYDKCVTLRLNEFDRSFADKKYTVIGIITKVRQFTTKSMLQMASVTIETYEREIDIIMFPSVWSSFRYLITEDKVLGFIVKTDKNSFEPKLICEKVVETDNLTEAAFREVHFAFSENISEEELGSFKSFLLENNGNCQVYFHIPDKPGKEIIIKAAPQLSTVSDEVFIKNAQMHSFIKSVWRE